MSLNSDDRGGAGTGAGAGAAAGLQAPKLRTGGYAAWRPDIEVYLARIGAGGAHRRSMEKDHWLTLVAQVATWSDEAVAAALADLGIGSGASSSSSSSSSTTVLTEREEATRKTIRLLVEQSTKAYGAIWSALPDELRAQASKGGEVPLNFSIDRLGEKERRQPDAAVEEKATDAGGRSSVMTLRRKTQQWKSDQWGCVLSATVQQMQYADPLTEVTQLV